jgi:hypothetical protein
VLRLDAEEQTGREAVDVVDARDKTVLLLDRWEMVRFEVPMGVADQPPNHREEEPRQQQGVEEDEDGEGPRRVDQFGELEEGEALAARGGAVDVAVAVLENYSVAGLAEM